MNPEALLELYENDTTEQVDVVFKSVNNEKQICVGEAYVPNVLDTHNEMMLPDAVEQLAHRFLSTLKNDQIDLMHNNRVVQAVVVESFIARKNDPDFNEGAWVLAIKVEDPELWADIKSGKYNGFSIECLVTKADAVVEFDYLPHMFGWTEKADGHSHAFFIQVDEQGNMSGTTSEENGHSHIIKYGTATQEFEDHAHRFILQ